jgi:hypothetical protein
MRIVFYLKNIFILVVTFLLPGCLLLNDVSPYNAHDLKVNPDRSLVIIGLSVESIESSYNFPKVGIGFDEYDATNQKITGNCWRYNNIDASVSTTPDKIRYFIFDVPNGTYSYSGFNSVRLQTQDSKTLAFLAPAGKVVYLGDFIRTNKKRFEMRHNLEYATYELKKRYPEFKGKLVIADSFPIPPPRMFLCTP